MVSIVAGLMPEGNKVVCPPLPVKLNQTELVLPPLKQVGVTGSLVSSRLPVAHTLLIGPLQPIVNGIDPVQKSFTAPSKQLQSTVVTTIESIQPIELLLSTYTVTGKSRIL